MMWQSDGDVGHGDFVSGDWVMLTQPWPDQKYLLAPVSWPVIGPGWSRDLNTGLRLVNRAGESQDNPGREISLLIIICVIIPAMR